MDESVIFYVSGHGFGHSARTATVIDRLLRERPGIRVIVKTSAPEWFFREQIRGDFDFFALECDTGVVQADSLNLDPAASLEGYTGFLERLEETAAAEAGFAGRENCRLIVGDIPPLAFEVAARAGVPSLAVANFSWDWIYEPYIERLPEYGFLLPAIREGYRKASLLLRLPFAGEMDAFPAVRDIPLIARRARVAAGEVRKRLGLENNRPLVILSFGGFSLGEEYYRQLIEIKDCLWLASERVGFDLPGLRNVGRKELGRLRLGYPDLVAAAEVVITKPGYGIISECIANRTRMLYTSRGEFREYPVLVEGIKRNLPSGFVSQEKLLSGDIRDELSRLLEAPPDFTPLPVDGAEAVAEIISGYL
ncbi:MAG: hypothetical protein P9M08_09060 [Candidatus Erginobacter occultus]|nr:hypothetical protein [Candidatus Erginobacter occultus]